MDPIPVRFDGDPDKVAALVNDFESGKLQVTVVRSEEIELIRTVYQIEFTDQTLFRRFVNGDIQRTNVSREAAAVADERTARTAADLLIQMGCNCRVTDGRMRIAESKLVKKLAGLGFASEPAIEE
jgi:hypothetical protein